MSNMIKVVVVGASGKMGKEIVKAVTNAEGMSIVGVCDISNVGEDIGPICGIGPLGVNVGSDLETILAETKADVMIDFTIAGVCEKNLRVAIDNNVHFVTGTTNMDKEVIDELFEIANKKKLGCLWAANFAIGAVLMMQFAQMAAKHMPACEIVELHHDKKLDAPSGTAKVTAELIAKARECDPNTVDKESRARGLVVDEVPIHSVRLSGYVASQEVIFGGTGQTLSIRHDSLGRESFMPGIVLAVRKVMESDHVIIGMDKILF